MTDFNVGEIVDAARRGVEPWEIAENYFVLYTPSGTKEIDLQGVVEARQDRPQRHRGMVSLATVDELAKYVEVHYDPSATTLWIDVDGQQVTAVLNDATDMAPAWRDHRAKVRLATTPEWEHWISCDGALDSQDTFAEHIEDGLAEIVKPDGADLLELAQSFHATSEASFRSARRLSSGEVRLQYDEEINATGGADGTMAIPDTFELLVAPFVGEERLALTARLKYRLTGGKLTIGYRLVRPDQVVRDALDLMAERLRGRFERVYLGSPS